MRSGTVIALIGAAALSVASILSGCDQKPIAGPLVLEPSKSVAHQIGRFDAADKTLVAHAGESGMLAYGPYADLAPGQYEATFIVSAGHGTGPVGMVDVNAFTPARQNNVLASRPIPAGASKLALTLPFDVPVGVKLEFRVSSDGITSIALHRTQIKKL